MKCKNCSAEFQGNFCTECGAKAENPPLKIEPQTIDPPISAAPDFKEKKKPFYKKWWFILIVVLALLISFISVTSGGEKVVWNDMVLGEMLPKPPEKRGEVHDNSIESLWVDISKVTPKQFLSYAAECAEKGFTVDSCSNADSYEAYNDKGYKLEIRYYDYNEELTIELDAPMKLSAIIWPDSEAGKVLPVPKSITGKITSEYEDSFFVYIGNTPKADYDEYVTSCNRMGFDVNYEKGENYYTAENGDGWRVRVEYLGGNIMSIDIETVAESTPLPTEEAAADTTIPDTTTKPTTTKPTTTKPTTTKPTTTKSSSIGLSADFKAAMDSYESFMNEYVEFMKKYNANPSDMALLSEYSNYMSRYLQFVEDFEKWDSTNMNDAEFAYYIDVQARVSKKLLEVSQ